MVCCAITRVVWADNVNLSATNMVLYMGVEVALDLTHPSLTCIHHGEELPLTAKCIYTCDVKSRHRVYST